MAKYAEGTSVPVEQSKAEIERILGRYKATGFLSGWERDMAFIHFVVAERHVRFRMTMPKRDDPKFTQYMRNSVRYARVEAEATKLWEQACRQKWRALALVIKAKLEAVDAGISVLESEFLSNIVMPDGKTVYEHIGPGIALAYESGKMPPLLPDYSREAK